VEKKKGELLRGGEKKCITGFRRSNGFSAVVKASEGARRGAKTVKELTTLKGKPK